MEWMLGFGIAFGVISAVSSAYLGFHVWPKAYSEAQGLRRAESRLESAVRIVRSELTVRRRAPTDARSIGVAVGRGAVRSGQPADPVALQARDEGDPRGSRKGVDTAVDTPEELRLRTQRAAQDARTREEAQRLRRQQERERRNRTPRAPWSSATTVEELLVYLASADAATARQCVEQTAGRRLPWGSDDQRIGAEVFLLPADKPFVVYAESAREDSGDCLVGLAPVLGDRIKAELSPSFGDLMRTSPDDAPATARLLRLRSPAVYRLDATRWQEILAGIRQASRATDDFLRLHIHSDDSLGTPGVVEVDA